MEKRLLYLLFAFILISGCLGQQGSGRGGESPSEEDSRLEEAKAIQSNFEDEYAGLYQAIERGDSEAAREHYDNLFSVYQTAKEIAGEEHLKFMVDEGALATLKEQIVVDDFKNANITLSNITEGCGISVCHLRSGRRMADLEFEYSIIKSSLDVGDIETAKEHYPAFESNFYESRDYVSKFLPEMTRDRMKDEYVTELKDSLYSGDLKRSRNAISVISNNTCSLSGCHRIFFT